MMRKLPRSPVIALLVACAPGGTAAVQYDGPAEPVRATESCTVERIVDGDTIQCNPVGRIRLLGIDTPERSQAPFGAMAAEALASFAPVGTRVEIETDVERTDRYRRVLGYLWKDGQMVNWLMVRGGWALVLTYSPNVQYADLLTAAQRSARDERQGLWARDGFECEPRARRRGDC